MKALYATRNIRQSLSKNMGLKNFSTFTVPLAKYEGVDFDMKSLPTTTQTTAEELLFYFRQLTEMRRMEVECDHLYKESQIRGFCHLYIGQEAVAAGMEAAITREDCVITSYREHCNQLARGDTPHRIIAEMMSRATGSTKGKGGSMHYYLSKNGFYGGHGIVGAQITLGTGLAFALKYQKKPNVCFTLYGDGSANQGQLFESANMAGLWKLPVIYTIENNHWGMGSSEHKTSFHHPLYSKFRSFPGLKSEGYDIFTVREIVKASKNYALNNGPLFLEFDTYRYQGHSMSDSGLTYRTKDDVTKVRETKDCINKIKSYILEFKVATENDLKGIEREIRENLAKDVEKCKSDPLPDPSELTTEVYIEKPAFIRGVEYHNSVFNDHKQ